MKSLLARLIIAATLLPAVAAADPVAPPDGKYRCYQPPEETVVAWFEIADGTVRIDGDDPVRFAFDAAARRIDWPTKALSPFRHGFFFPPGTADDHGERTTIVLAKQRRAQPGSAGWKLLPRCYLTTH